MFSKLRQRWNVSGGRLVLILATFAIGGSLCGRAAGLMLRALAVTPWPLYVTLYIVLVTVLWPLAVLLVSLPLGQFLFFRRYLKRVWSRIRTTGTV